MIGDFFEPHEVICEGFLSLLCGILQLATQVDCSWLGGSPSSVQHPLRVCLWIAN